MSVLLKQLRRHPLLCDGGMGSSILAQGLCEITNCIDALTLTHSDEIRSLHESFLRAGADVIQTNTFGAAPHSLKRFGLAHQSHELNRRAAEIAREAIARVPSSTPRFVLGSVGPGSEKLSAEAWQDSYAEQCAGLIAGGADGITLETFSVPKQIEAAVKGARRAMLDAAADLPLLVHVTPGNASLLKTAATWKVDVLGFNCGAGLNGLEEELRSLRQSWPGLLSLQPSAGLPGIINGRASYPVSPAQMAEQMEPLVRKYRVNLLGGCCGTTPDHIAALRAMLKRLPPIA